MCSDMEGDHNIYVKKRIQQRNRYNFPQEVFVDVIVSTCSSHS